MEATLAKQPCLNNAKRNPKLNDRKLNNAKRNRKLSDPLSAIPN